MYTFCSFAETPCRSRMRRMSPGSSGGGLPRAAAPLTTDVYDDTTSEASASRSFSVNSNRSKARLTDRLNRFACRSGSANVVARLAVAPLTTETSRSRCWAPTCEMRRVPRMAVHRDRASVLVTLSRKKSWLFVDSTVASATASGSAAASDEAHGEVSPTLSSLAQFALATAATWSAKRATTPRTAASIADAVSSPNAAPTDSNEIFVENSGAATLAMDSASEVVRSPT
mmetsp:Transcript_9588/g.30397  ORF Transcript_9588/g.30397 Transcript_9588/m.30397 type:complete len:229 (-) Transcript_9588:903-1589(-)